MVAIVLALIVGSISGVATYFGGDKLVLAVSGAREVDEAAAPQLLNVVREMAIAANVPMPKVYIIDDTAPNAFATGRDPAHASVAITTGLSRSSIARSSRASSATSCRTCATFDIRFSLIVGVMVGAIAILADFFLRFTFWGGLWAGGRTATAAATARRRSSCSSSPSSWRSSRRSSAASSSWRSTASEYLADASSVELTRNPYGLERALAKIAGDQEVLEVANRGTQHMYFTNPIKKFEARSSGLMDTHPPILDRINRLRELTGEPPLQGARRPTGGAGLGERRSVAVRPARWASCRPYAWQASHRPYAWHSYTRRKEVLKAPGHGPLRAWTSSAERETGAGEDGIGIEPRQIRLPVIRGIARAPGALRPGSGRSSSRQRAGSHRRDRAEIVRPSIARLRRPVP